MSYDLLVFDPISAPRKHAEFMAWYEERMDAAEEATPSDDPSSLTPALQKWFTEMIKTFPALNGPMSSDDSTDNPKVTDYGLNGTCIHACFGWSQAEAAHKHTAMLAEKYGVGLFNMSSSEGDVWIPGRHGKLEEVKD